MKTLEGIGQEFEKNLSSAASITELNQKILDIATEAIQSLGRIPGQYGGDAGQNQINALSNLMGNREIEATLKVVYGQQIVLYISTLESYLKDLTRYLGNSNINLFKWKDGEKLTIETKDLNKKVVTTGDMVLSAILKKDTNFQDLGSIKRFFENYLEIELDFSEDIEQAYILATAMRHVIVHSNSKVDADFMHQIRSLSTETKRAFQIDRYIPITQLDVDTTRDALMNMYTFIETKIRDKIRDDA